MRSASRRIGTQTSSVKCGPLSSWAACSARRPAISASASCASSATATSSAPASASTDAYRCTSVGRATRTVGLDDDRSGAPRGEPVVREPLHRVDRRPVEHLDQGRPRPLRPQRHDARGGRLQGPERRERRQRRVRRRDQPYDDRRHDAQQPLGPDEQPGEVEPGDALGRAAAGPHHLSAGQDDLETAHVVGRHPVLHAAEPARVGRDVAADRAARRRCRVGRVAQSDRRGGGLERRVDDAGADHGEALELVELVDLRPVPRR